MLVSQFVDYIEKGTKSAPNSGISRRSAALESAARNCDIPLETLKRDVNKAANYFYLLEKAGLGHLLELGFKVTSL